VFLARRENGDWKYHCRADLGLPLRGPGNPDAEPGPSNELSQRGPGS
jgi:hypothetical protein